jgi:hypothetical protein
MMVSSSVRLALNTVILKVLSGVNIQILTDGWAPLMLPLRRSLNALANAASVMII